MSVTAIPFTNHYAGSLATLRVRGKGETLVRITKVNKVNTDSVDEEGLKYRGPHSIYRNAPEGAVFTSKAPEKPALSFLEKGTVVRIMPSSPYFKYSSGGTQLYVITSQTREQTHNAFPLGGGRRYLPKVTSADVEVVDPALINR